MFRPARPEVPRSYAILDSPIGPLTLVSRGELLSEVRFPEGSEPAAVADAVGASGALTGFGGGLDTKRWLLDHERQPSLFPGA